MSTEQINDQPEQRAYQPQRKGMSGWVIFLIVLGVFVVFFGGIALIVSSSFSEFEASIGGGGKELAEKTVIHGKGETPGKIAMISLEGPIAGAGSQIDGEGSMYEVARRLKKAAEDESVDAVLFQVASPGGGLNASDIIHNEVLNIKEAGKPVVVWISGLAASGGLYVSAPADWIVASPTSLVGSIGVIMQRMQVSELMDKIGIKVEPIKSGKMKDLGSPFRDLTPEEKQYFQNLIDTFHEKFVTIVSEGRGIEIEKVREIANGKIYTVDQSKEYGLIDDIGYIEAALEKAQELAGLESANVIKYKEPFDIETMFGKFPFGGKSSFEDTKLLLQTLIDMSVTPEVRAIWAQ